MRVLTHKQDLAQTPGAGWLRTLLPIPVTVGHQQIAEAFICWNDTQEATHTPVNTAQELSQYLWLLLCMAHLVQFNDITTNFKDTLMC